MTSNRFEETRLVRGVEMRIMNRTRFLQNEIVAICSPYTCEACKGEFVYDNDAEPPKFCPICGRRNFSVVLDTAPS